MKKDVYGLYFELNNQQVLFYVGCTNDIKRRESEHKRAFLDAKHAEFDTYKYQLCRELASAGIDFSLKVIEPMATVTTEADEYSWILRSARLNESLGIHFYDGMPLTNMRAGDFLSEMLRDKTITTASDIQKFKRQKQAEARAKKEIDYTRKNSFGDQSRGSAARRNVANSLVMITETKTTEQTLKDLQKRARASKRKEELKRVRAEQEAAWLATGQLIGEKK